MEPKFNQTFIPKRPVSSSPKQTVSRRSRYSFLGVVGTVLFVLAVLAVGGIWGYQEYLNKEIDSKKVILEQSLEAIEGDFIEEVEDIDQRINLAQDILGDHLVPSRFFAELQDMTLQKVRFLDFSYETTPGANPVIFLTGVSPDYESVALQSDIFANSENIQSSLFTDLALTEEGEVSFVVSATVDKNLTSYK